MLLAVFYAIAHDVLQKAPYTNYPLGFLSGVSLPVSYCRLEAKPL